MDVNHFVALFSFHAVDVASRCRSQARLGLSDAPTQHSFSSIYCRHSAWRRFSSYLSLLARQRGQAVPAKTSKTLKAALILQLFVMEPSISRVAGFKLRPSLFQPVSRCFDAALMSLPPCQRRVWAPHNHRPLCAVRDAHSSGRLWCLVLCRTWKDRFCSLSFLQTFIGHLKSLSMFKRSRCFSPNPQTTSATP